MPWAPARPCRGALTARRCRARTTDRDGWCPSCRPAARREADDTPWRRRAHRFYKTAAWQRCRAAVKARDPVCVLCRVSWSTTIDHWPRPLRWFLSRGLDTEAADPANSRGLCKPCSDRISGKESKNTVFNKP